MRFHNFTDINGDDIAVNLDAVEAISDRKNFRAVQLSNGNMVYVTETMDEIGAALTGADVQPAAPAAPAV